MSNTTFGTSALRLYDMGYPVLPAKGKRILLDQWPTRAITRDDVAQWAANGSADANIGCRTGDDSLGVPIVLADVDIYDKDVARTVAASLEDYFGATIERRGMAPKRGLVFVSKGAWPKIATTFRSPDGVKHTVEWLGAGQQFIAYGTHPDTGRPYTYRDDKGLLDVEPWELTQVDVVDVEQWQQTVLPGLVPADWVQVGSTGGGVGGVGQVLAPDERALLNFKPKLDLDWEEVRRAVLILDANMGHDEWAKVLMAIHHQSGGGEEGLALAHEWSAKGESYKAREVETKWRSFKDDPSRGGLVTMATVLKMVGGGVGGGDGGAVPKEARIEARQNWEARFAAAADEHDVVQVAREAGRDRALQPVDLAKLVGLAQAKLQAFGVRMLIKDVRAMFKPARQEVQNTEGAPMEPWAEDYAWCKQEDCFIHIPTQQPVTVQSFNAAHGRDVRGAWTNEDGYTQAASYVALHELQVPVVAKRMYLPWADTFFEYDGMPFLNSYRPSSVPDAKLSATWTDAERDYVARVTRHIDALLGAADAAVVLGWMAWSVQNPGKKIRWSLLLKGIEGDGKSFLGNLLEAVMGLANVGRVSPKLLNTDFNGWAEGHCICVIEELKLTGHNRFDVLNALKELHTNPTVTIHRKGIDSYQAANTQNYLAFTNYNDAIPVTDADRRWFISFSRFNAPEELLAAGMDAAYFKDLFDGLETHTEAVRGWLLEYDTTGFEANGRAPESMAKRVMVAATIHDEDQAVLEIIEQGAVGVSKDVVSTSHLTTHLTMYYPDLEVPKGKGVSNMMNRLGFYKVAQRVKWNGAAQRVWVRDLSVTENNDLIRHLLDATNIEQVEF